MSAPNLGRGRLRVFLGYAAGVGKTYEMLSEAQRLKNEGVDIVIGYFEPHGRKDTIAKTEGIEAVPRRRIEYRGTVFEEMDTEAIVARHPQVCAVDEFAHTNVPGSPRLKRWEDVHVLLDAGIDVLTTMNVQHIESLNDQIWQISGIRVRETIPDWVIKEADEVVMVDVTPRALIHRLERGVVYAPDKAARALANFFQEGTLAALRELAMRQTAHEVEIRHAADGRGSQDALTSDGKAAARRPADRLLICIGSEAASAALIRRGRRVADFLQADCFAVYVRPVEGNALSDAEREALDRHVNFARNLHIDARLLEGADVAQTIVEFAREQQITQIFMGRPHQFHRLPMLGRNLVQRVVDLARDMQITIVAERRRQS